MEFYKPFHRVDVEESPDSLMFTVVPQHSVVEWVFIGGLAIAGAATAAFHAIPGVTMLVFAGLLAWSRIFATTRILQVTRRGVHSDQEVIPWTGIQSLEYDAGGENDPSGLVLRKPGWGSRLMLLQDVDRGDAETIVKAIYTKFWDVEMAPNSSGFLHGLLHKGPLTLGLSNNDRQHQQK